jgi:hypothetical protein
MSDSKPSLNRKYFSSEKRNRENQRLAIQGTAETDGFAGMNLKKSDKLQFVEVLTHQQTEVCWTLDIQPALQGSAETDGFAGMNLKKSDKLQFVEVLTHQQTEV